MKTDYVLKHVGPNIHMIVCVFPNNKLAQKAMEYYAKYVEWDWNTKITYQCSWEIQFENNHSIIICNEQRASSMKDFKKMICFDENLTK